MNRSAVLLVSAAAFNASGINPAFAHEAATGQNYEKFRQPNGASCCNDRDCRPVNFVTRADGVLMFPDGRPVAVPNDRISRLPSDDGLAHWCGVLRPNGEATTYCAILPLQAAQIDNPDRSATSLATVAVGAKPQSTGAEHALSSAPELPDRLPLCSPRATSISKGNSNGASDRLKEIGHSISAFLLTFRSAGRSGH